LIPKLARRVVTYGMRSDCDFCIRILPAEPATIGSAHPFSRFEVVYRKASLGEFHLYVPGIHNVLNATAAIAVAVGLDMKPADIQTGLENFRGVDRRFQLKGTASGVAVVDDYGHHPTEIRATISAARQCGYRRIHVVFQPHRYTRTRDLMDDFVTSFQDADTVQVMDIYPASEQPIAGITGEVLAEKIAALRPKVDFAPSFEDAITNCMRAAQSGDLVLTLGAGNISQIGPMLLQALEQRSAEVPSL
jgi:UDP-N-acetylmuramate--alanine ligase